MSSLAVSTPLTLLRLSQHFPLICSSSKRSHPTPLVPSIFSSSTTKLTLWLTSQSTFFDHLIESLRTHLSNSLCTFLNQYFQWFLRETSFILPVTIKEVIWRNRELRRNRFYSSSVNRIPLIHFWTLIESAVERDANVYERIVAKIVLFDWELHFRSLYWPICALLRPSCPYYRAAVSAVAPKTRYRLLVTIRLF